MISRRFFPNDRGHAYRFLGSPTALLTLLPPDSAEEEAKDFFGVVEAVGLAVGLAVDSAVDSAVAQAQGLAPGLAAEDLAQAH